MSVFVNREGNISIFRVGIFLALIGAAIGIGGYLLVQYDQAQRRSPYFVDVYPGATEWFTQKNGETSQTVTYQVVGISAEEVASYYQRELDRHLDGNPNDPNREQCVRTPGRGEFADYVPGSGNLPYFYRCVFDNSTVGATQFTTVTVEPGVRNDNAEPPVDNTGITIIQYEQIWSR